MGILLTTAVAATWLGVAPASADDTTVTFTVTTGALDIAAPLGPIALTNGTLVPGGDASGQIGPVMVTDARGLADAPWTATVSSTVWSDGLGVANIPSTAAAYTTGTVTQTGTGICGGGPGGPIPTTPATLVAASHSGGPGGNTCSWNPTVTVTIPVTASVATYTATVQHLVAGA